MIVVSAPFGPGSIDKNIPAGANWMLHRDIFDSNGQKVTDIFTSAPSSCQRIIQPSEARTSNGGIRVKANPGGGDPIGDCLNSAGWYETATYQPSYRYGKFQEIESSLYLGLTALAVGVTYWLVLKRDA